MFAYCPQISRPKCGIIDDNTETYEKHEFHLRAGRSKKTVSASKLKYEMQGGHMINGQLKIVSKEEAEYDACYYEVWLDEKVK